MGKRFGAAIGEQIDHHAALDVDEDTRIGVPFAPRPIVNTQTARRGWIAHRGAANQPDAGVTTGGVIQVVAEALASRAAKRDADLPLLLGHTSGAPGPRRRDLREAFGKHRPRTLGSRTEAFAHMQLQPDGDIRPGQIEQCARRGAMDAGVAA